MKKYLDTYRHKGLRKALIQTIRAKGIRDESVLQAMDEVPRHYFFDSSFLEYAYDDKPFPIGSGQTISQPYTVAFQTQLLGVKKGDKVLEVGTGSGYQASILAAMGARVYSIERHKSLYEQADKQLSNIGFSRIHLFYGDGYKGLPAFAPFDKILVTAGAPYIPDALKRQLTDGGTLVIPVGREGTQIMKRIIRKSGQDFISEDHGYFRFVPLLEDKTDQG